MSEYDLLAQNDRGWRLEIVKNLPEMAVDAFKQFKFDMYQLRYEDWATSKCHFETTEAKDDFGKTKKVNKLVTTWDINEH